VAAQHSHGHSSSEPCACVAEEFGFPIDCTTATGTAKVQTAYDYLVANNCKDIPAGETVVKCADETDYAECVKNWFIVKTHHDHCPEDVVPTTVEQQFHVYEQAGCLGCEIKKNYRPALSMCPTVDCTNTDVILSAKDVIGDGTDSNKCTDDTGTTASPNNDASCCTSNAQKGSWQITRAYHDICEFTQITALDNAVSGIETFVEHTIHEFEGQCETFECNVSPEGLDQSVCPATVASEWEWGGVFTVPENKYTWVMQAATANDPDSYADPSMRLVVIPTDQTMNALTTLSVNECDGSYLMAGACQVIEDGETMGPPAATGSCYELHVKSTSHDTTFTLDLTGTNGVAFYAQHVPTEFERDQHYLKLQDGSRTTNA